MLKQDESNRDRALAARLATRTATAPRLTLAVERPTRKDEILSECARIMGEKK